MHELFTKVLSKRDLSKAGDLFSVPDSEIVNDLSEVLTEIEPIISQQDYLKNTNDQSVVEICVTRILSCIRETKTADRYCATLVKLLEICLHYNLEPEGTNKDDPPHAKISADIISSIFLNYDKKHVMVAALPIAVKFLSKGNKELSKNLASYLSLAAIEYAYLLSEHVGDIMKSIVGGNYGLCRVLSQIYEASPEKVTPHAPLLVTLLPLCDASEKLALLHLFALIAQKKPTVLEGSVPALCEYLVDSSAASETMLVLLKLAENRPNLILKYFDKIKNSTTENPTTIALAAQILATTGKVNKDKAQYALDFVLEHLPHADRTSQTILLHEATKLCSSYPVLFTDKVLACVRQKNSISQPESTSSTSHLKSDGNKTSGGVTIVKLNSPTPQHGAETEFPKLSTAGSEISQNTGVAAATSTTTANVHRGRNTRSSPNSPKEFKKSATSSNANIKGGGHIVTIHTSTINSSSANNKHTNNTVNITAPTTAPTTPISSPTVPPTPPHTGYTRRVKLGDSRSTGRLHPSSHTHRSMTRLNIAGGSVGGLHKSMTRLSSSQHINQNGSNSNNANSNGNVTTPNSTHNVPHSTSVASPTYVTPVPPLSNDVIITGHSKWGIPSTKVTSGGVTVTTSPTRIRPHSQGPITLLGSSGALGKYSTDALNQSTGSINVQQNNVSVHHASPASPSSNGNQKSITNLPVNASITGNNHEVVVSGPTTNISPRRNDNTSYTLLNANNSIVNQRMSTFEPYQITRDPVQQFCEKNFQSIKKYMDKLSQYLPPPTRCSIEERRTKKVAKLHFACQIRGPHCLYSKTCFTMQTRNPKTWIHLMFLDFQVRHYVKERCVLSTREPGISNLKHIWEILKCENRNFTELVTSHFPNMKDREVLINELRHSGFLDVFEVLKTDQSKPNANELDYQWGCFLCNNPDKAVDLLSGNNQTMIEGDLKEKKGKWRLFRRWRTRYFTLSGAHLSCKGSSGESIDVNQIRSVKVSRGARNIPKAFEIFTGDQTLILKPKDSKKAEEWVKCLSIAVAQSQARDNPTGKTNSLPARGLSTSKTAF